MNVVVSSLARLRKRYGHTGVAQVEEALDELETARAAAGIASLRYMVELGVPQLGVAGAPLEWHALVEQLGAIAGALATRNERLESVLIVGGPQVVPFGLLTNPVQDRDRALPTDCVYGAAMVGPVEQDEEGLATSIYGVDWPVGRLPDADEALPTLLVHSIRAAAAQHRRGELALTPALCYSTASWRTASQSVCAEINTLLPAGESFELIESPPTTADRLDRSVLGGARMLYCNLHGISSAPHWYGQDRGNDALVTALRPDDFIGLDLSGTVLVSAACYGALLNHHTVADSLALRMLGQGLAAFIGATVITYGPLQPPSSEADLLIVHVLRQIYSLSGNIGEAFLGGRIAMLREIMMERGYLDDDDAKTLLGFVLYGDPTIRIAADRTAS